MLSPNLMEFKPEMGWSSRSWVITNRFGDSTTRLLIIFRWDWWWPLLVGASLVSAVKLILFWDGSPAFIVQRGLTGFPISLVMILIVLLARQPAIAFWAKTFLASAIRRTYQLKPARNELE